MPDTHTPTVLIVPGYTNSGPQHWQSLWQAERPEYRRVEQRHWDAPTVPDWIDVLGHSVRNAAPAPTVLVAHSLGCLAVAHWVQVDPMAAASVIGALLVAPPDVERKDALPVLQSFAPIPRGPLPFRSIVVASENDPYAGLAWSHQLAGAWGAHLVNVGSAGHINTASGLGIWPKGQDLLADLLATVRAESTSTMQLEPSEADREG